MVRCQALRLQPLSTRSQVSIATNSGGGDAGVPDLGDCWAKRQAMAGGDVQTAGAMYSQAFNVIPAIWRPGRPGQSFA